MVSSPSGSSCSNADRRVPVQLEHGEEARDDDAGLLGAGDELAEGHRLAAAQQRDDVGGLLADADQRRVQVVEPDRRGSPAA